MIERTEIKRTLWTALDLVVGTSVINKDTNYRLAVGRATHAWLPAIEAASSAL